MSYAVAVNVTGPVRRKIARWSLPDFLLVEVYIRLAEDLKDNPATRLVRTKMPFDGMVFYVTCVDPENRLTEHHCYFHVLYSQDETTIEVVNFAYRRTTGM